MIELITIGETMAAFIPAEHGFIRYTDSFKMQAAGAESNVAIILSKLGHRCGWISQLGDDEFGQYLLRVLRGEGVDTSQVKLVSDAITGLMFKQTNGGETAVFYRRKDSAASRMEPSDINWEYIKQAKLLHLTGVTAALSSTCLNTIRELTTFAAEHSIQVSFDPNIRLKLWNRKEAKEKLRPFLMSSDIALLGLDEAEILLDTTDPEKIIDRLRGAGVRTIAIKNGAKGAIVADQSHVFTIPPVKTTVVDTVGAGDAFNAGFLCGLLEEMPLEQCGTMGCLAGSMAVASSSDFEGIPSRSQFDNLLLNTHSVLR